MSKFFKKILGSIYGHLRSAYYENRYDFYCSKYGIKSNFKFSGTDIRIYGEGQLELGNNSYIGTNSSIQLALGAKVKIGNNCQISHNVRIYTMTNIADQDFLTGGLITKSGDVIIGDGVWIGANVFINPGVTVNDNAIIGANSVLTKDVDKQAIVGGVPARLIRYKKSNLY
jgi:maltose O-acetyltransferase